MHRKQQRVEQQSPGYIPQTQDGLNNVSDLISKFEVRNYPINSGLLPELSPPRPGFIVPGAECYEASYRPYGGSARTVYHHYSPTHSPPLGQSRRRLPNSLPYDPKFNDTASLSDGGDSVQSGRMDDRRFRPRPGGGHYYRNGSLSSLNESDYYEEVFDVGARTPPTGGRYYQQQQRYGDGALLEEVEDAPLNKERVTSTLTRFGAILQMLSRIPFPRMSVTGMGLCSLVAIFFCPRAIGSNILFPGFRLLFGTLYPAYASYKAVRTKNVKEYVKWMMYWIVFAFFTFIETFTDILLSWFPFYYEIKVIVVLWLLSPATRGSSTLYRKFVHPMLTRREQEIDDYINQAKEKGYTAVLQLGSKGVNYATNVIMQTAIKGGGGLVQTLRKSYSLSDLSEPDTQRTQDEVDEIVNRPQRVLRSKSSRSSSGNRQMEMYFPEVEIAGAPYHATAAPPYNYIRSSDDISSGYSSAEPGLSRTASMSNTARPRLKSKTREDQDEYGADIFYDEQDLLYAANNRGAIRAGDSTPQRASIYELHAGGVSSLPAITQAEHTVESASPLPIYSSGTQAVQRVDPIGNVPAEMNDKYKLFLAWMEEQQKRGKEVEPESTGMVSSNEENNESSNMLQREQETRGHGNERPLIEEQELVASVKQEELERSSTIEPIPTTEDIVTSVEPVMQEEAMEDNFMDTISVSSNENDEFLEVEATSEPMEELNNHEQAQKEDAVKQEPVEEIKETPERVTAPEETVITESNVNSEVDRELKMTEERVELPSVVEEKEQQEQPTATEEQFAKDIAMPLESSNLMVAACSNSNLTSSNSSLAVSEGSTGSVINLANEGTASVQAKKHPSFGKQRKAPPVPPPPEMIVIREPPKITTTVATPPAPTHSNPPNAEVRNEKRPMAVSTRTGSPLATVGGATQAAEKSKPKKFMSSLTGMFKGHGDTSSSSSTTPSSRSNESAQPPEKMSASCTTLPRTKKPEKVTKTRSKTEKPSV
ncbi:uncharacterized protein LOC128310699 [Anopheles moucheti]|uniref:uncharacterized protein LOC128310699 n=1 Tax=Anopheles moucheti TaxID=186751 RepID=UPI0022EFF48F|nr:uncharacterized protein LOC128310699 [Anopheles moucheti]